MQVRATNHEYVIHLIRRPGECVVNIPELCISETGGTPQESLANALRAEADMLRKIEADGGALPPLIKPDGPFAGFWGAIGRHLAFAKQVVIGYALVAFISLIILLLVLPSARSRVEQYLLGPEVAADARKIFTKLGLTACLQNP